MSELLRLLQVEDTESDAALILRLLEKSGYNVHAERVEDSESMRQALARQPWDVIVADYQLPQLDAPGALRIRNECAPETPFIVVSGTIGEERAVEMIRAGAQDYVLKDRLARLAAAVQRETRGARARAEHQRVEHLLHERDEWLALVVETTHLGMFDFYPQTGKLVLSPEGCRHAGLPTGADLTFEMFIAAVHPDDRSVLDGVIRRAFIPGRGGEFTADYRTVGLNDEGLPGTEGLPSKDERWLAAQGRVFFDSEGKAVRFVGVTLDITQRRQLEEQFRQAQKMESVGMLAGGVAHDFNNLLTIIAGFGRMALDGLPPQDPLRSDLGEVLKASDRASDLTRQLLALSRRQPVQTEVIALNKLVSNVQKMLARLVGENIEMILRLHPAAGSVRADPGHIDQVIMNLVVNARDAMPDGGKIFIETGSRLVEGGLAELLPLLPPGPYATLTVRDTGGGMSPEVCARIFDPFFTTKAPGKGTGLGLSTVYGIVRQAGGMISVSSEVGHGARFTVFLPTVQEERRESTATPSASLRSGGETILVAEDDPGVRRFIRVSLEMHGYRILECRNGLEAIEQARLHGSSIDLLLTDVVMPEMSGADLAEQFKTCRPGVPVLFMSGYNEAVWPKMESRETCLQKPFTSAALLKRLRTVLDRSNAVAHA